MKKKEIRKNIVQKSWKQKEKKNDVQVYMDFSKMKKKKENRVKKREGRKKLKPTKARAK